VQVEDWSGGLTGYEYDVAGHLITTTLPNGVTTTYRYDAANRLIDLAHTATDDILLSSYSYELDHTGNRVRVVETLTETTHTITYTYDGLYRLTEADYSTGENFQYAYDTVGNRTLVTSTTPLSGTVVTTFTYDAANRLIKRVVDGNDTFLYTWSDANQLTQEVWDGYSAVRVFEYDYAGRLITVTLPGLSTTFQYDGDGHRLVKAVNGDPVTYTLDYARDARMLVEHSITSTRHYLYGRQCIGEVNDAAQAWSYYLGDGAGRVRQVSDEAGAIDFAWSYTTLGEVLSGPKGYHVLLDCPDGVYDWSTGLILLNGRYFDPTLGIWIALGPLMMVQLWQGRKKKRRRRIWYALLLVVCVGGWLTACDDSCYEVLKTFSLGGLQDHGMFQNPCKAEGVQLKWDQVYPDEVDRVERALNAAFAMYSSPLGFYTPDMAAQELGISAKRPLRLRRETVHPEEPQALAAAGGGSIFVYNNFFGETGDWDASVMGHEFAHLWDERQNPSHKFSKELQGWTNWDVRAREYSYKNDREDFATAVQGYFWHETASDRGWTDDFGELRQDAIDFFGAPDEPDQLAIIPRPPSTEYDGPQLTLRGTEGSERLKDRYDYVQMLFLHKW
jgi:YD repeat-containing protein